MVGMRLSALRLPFSAHDLVRKPDATHRIKSEGMLFGIMHGGGDFFLAWWWLAKLGRARAARTMFHLVIASGSEAIQWACTRSWIASSRCSSQ
jgi:hypothetical protein